MFRVFAMLALLLAVLPATAQPRLELPIDCEIGRTCYIEDYVDVDPTQGRQQDFACGINSRDGHKGTDIALLSFAEVTHGVTVRAAADGMVRRSRDGMADDRLMRGVTYGNACGNAVLVDHGKGWQTLYCHLREGSLLVQPGARVAAGDALGLVGLSGQTNHPHLHFGVLHNGQPVDPFRPHASESCGPADASLWANPPQYTKTGLITAGFADHVPDMASVRDGSARLIKAVPERPLVVYARAGHAQHGDLLTLTIDGPDGEVFRRETVLKAPKVNLMRAAGRKAPQEGWPPGEYLGEALLTRQGIVIAHRFAHVAVEAQP